MRMNRTTKWLTVIGVSLMLALAFTQPAPADPDFEWQELGQSVFNANCVACHGAAGIGIPGAFPPLAGHVPDILAIDGGRELLANIVLYGLVGSIEVNGVAFTSAMPPWAHLSDEALAAVLNHVATSWGNIESLPSDTVLFGPSDIAGARGKEISGIDVHALRSQVLGLSDQTNGQDSAASNPEQTTTLNDEVGYFTSAQAESGLQLYREHCSACHGQTLRGGLHAPPITNLAFFREWGGRTFDTLYAFIANQMPIDNPGQLRQSQYVDIAAYWLSFNDYPAGDVALSNDPAVLSQILIERR